MTLIIYLEHPLYVDFNYSVHRSNWFKISYYQRQIIMIIRKTMDAIFLVFPLRAAEKVKRR